MGAPVSKDGEINSMITVVIPLYNAEKTIVQALDSVRTQTAAQLISKVIVVDDGSEDSSADKVREYIAAWPQFPLQLICRQNAGAAAARNTGMRLVETPYIAFLDADDIWLPAKLQRQWETIQQNPQIRFLGTGWEEKPLQIGRKKITELYNGTVKDICIKNFPYVQSVLMETSLVEEVGYFDESRRYAEDMNYFQKIAVKGNYYFLPEKLIQMDIGKDYFAQSGLSSHLREMHRGTLQNIRELRRDGAISFLFWLEMRIFYQLKYYRRCIRKMCNQRKDKQNSSICSCK